MRPSRRTYDPALVRRLIPLLAALLLASPAAAQNDWGVEWKDTTGNTEGGDSPAEGGAQQTPPTDEESAGTAGSDAPKDDQGVEPSGAPPAEGADPTGDAAATEPAPAGEGDAPTPDEGAAEGEAAQPGVANEPADEPADEPGGEPGDARAVDPAPGPSVPLDEVELSTPHILMGAGAAAIGLSILAAVAIGISQDSVETSALILGGGIGAGVITLGVGGIMRRRRLLDAGHTGHEGADRPLPRGPQLQLTLHY